MGVNIPGIFIASDGPPPGDDSLGSTVIIWKVFPLSMGGSMIIPLCLRVFSIWTRTRDKELTWISGGDEVHRSGVWLYISCA